MGRNFFLAVVMVLAACSPKPSEPSISRENMQERQKNYLSQRTVICDQAHEMVILGFERNAVGAYRLNDEGHPVKCQ